MPRAKRQQFPHHDSEYIVVEAALEVNDAVRSKLFAVLDATLELRCRLYADREADLALGRSVRAAGGTHNYLTKSDAYRSCSAFCTSAAGRVLHSQVAQDVADRQDRAYKAWLKGERGRPQPPQRRHHRSFTFTQYGFAAKIRGGRLHLSKLGEARLLGMRKLPGRPKAVTMMFKQGRWFAQFTCEVQKQHSVRALRIASNAVKVLPDTGLDTGLMRICTLADGSSFAPWQPLKAALPSLAKAQRRMSRQFEMRKALFRAYCKDFVERELHGPLPELKQLPLSNRLKGQIRRVAVLHTKVANVRRDQLRKVARQIEQNYRLFAVEEHGVRFMQRNRRQARKVSDVAPALFKSILKHTLGAGRYVPVGTSRPGVGGNSQTCLCGASVPKPLSRRTHDCPECGLSGDRDVVSANIAMRIGLGYSTYGAGQKLPDPGQGLVRRGESKGRQQATALSVPGAGPASELPAKRPSSGNLRLRRKTAGAQATAAVKNMPLLSRAHARRLSG